MPSHIIEGFDFLRGAIVFENDNRTKWRVRLPVERVPDCRLGPNLIAALGANKDRVVGFVVCRFEDGTPASSALYLDSEGGLHWTDPIPANNASTVPQGNSGGGS